jgi:hypothetical protein
LGDIGNATHNTSREVIGVRSIAMATTVEGFRGLRTPFQRMLAVNEAMSACKSSPVICRSTWIQLVVNLPTEYPLTFVR